MYSAAHDKDIGKKLLKFIEGRYVSYIPNAAWVG